MLNHDKPTPYCSETNGLKPFLARNPMCDLFAVGEFCVGSVCVVFVPLSQSRRPSLFGAGVVQLQLALEIVVRDG